MADKYEYLNNLGISKGDMAKPANAYEAMLLELAKQLTLDLRDAVESKADNTGGLASSIAALPSGKMKVSIKADYYFKFMDEGVEPTTGKRYDSPHKFKYKNVSESHVKALQEWKGYSAKRAYASAYVTKNVYGLKPRNIIDDTVTQDALKKMSNDLSTLMGMTLEVVWDKNTKTWR
jgi:hypothetical protein